MVCWSLGTRPPQRPPSPLGNPRTTKRADDDVDALGLVGRLLKNARKHRPDRGLWSLMSHSTSSLWRELLPSCSRAENQCNATYHAPFMQDTSWLINPTLPGPYFLEGSLRLSNQIGVFVIIIIMTYKCDPTSAQNIR